MIKRTFLLFCLFSLTGLVAEGSDALLTRLVKGTNLVYDYAGVFEPLRKTELEDFLRGVEQKTAAEIAVVVLPSLEGGDINDFADRLFEKWGIGKKDKDNGLLLLAAIEDRKVRIEVGYGLEGALPDAKTGRILDEHVIPEFKQQKFAEGLMLGAGALAVVVVEEAGVDMELPADMQAKESSDPTGALVGMILIALLAGLLMWAKKKGWIKPSRGGSGMQSHNRSGNSGSSSSGSSFGGGSSGGGGASRGW